MARQQRIEKLRRTVLTPGQRFELESGYPSSSEGSGSDFINDDDRRDAWEAHRDELMSSAVADGRDLPWAHLFYDLGIADPNREREDRELREVDAIDGSIDGR